MRWVSAVASRQEKPWVRSAEVGDLTGPMVELVGTNHDEFLEDMKDKDVFIDYYAPWCSHCVKLHPTYEQIAQYFKFDTELIIARFDATKNDVVGDWLRAYPTLMFYPQGVGKLSEVDEANKDAPKNIEYRGARDFDTMKDWLLSKSDVLKNRPTMNADAIKEDL